MTAKQKSFESCLLCDEGGMVPVNDLKYKFKYGPHEYTIEGLSHAVCNKCGTSSYLHGQLAENKKRIREYQTSLVKIMGPSDILALRVKYSLSQAQAAQIFGGGANAFSKWERGEVIPTESTANLLRLAFESDDAMVRLAKHAGVQLNQGAGFEPLLKGATLVGWLWNVTEQVNAPPFVNILEMARTGTINDDRYENESQSAAA